MIGQYVIRCGEAGQAVSFAHLVESEIADRVVLRCGRQMQRRTVSGSLRPAGPADTVCFWCTATKDRAPERVGEAAVAPV